MSLLEVKGLSAEIAGNQVFTGIDMAIEEGESNILFGPNGSGKTSLLLTILGVPDFKVTSGKIIFQGNDVTDKPLDERARMGMGVGFQQPPEVTGVKLKELLKICENDDPSNDLSPEAKTMAERLMLTDYLERDVNVGFSGGERKRAEVMQLLLMKPKLLLLDEPDSGVDVESLKLIAGEIQEYLKREKASALIITHQGYILDYIEAERACVFMEGGMYCQGSPKKILADIMDKGYRGCVECHMKNPGN